MANSPCPICGFHQVSTEAVKCPQCDADLTCFTVLDEIPDEVPTVSVPENPVPAKRSWENWIIPGGGFLFLGGLLSVLIFIQVYHSEPSPAVLPIFPTGIKIPVQAPLHSGDVDRTVQNELAGPKYVSRMETEFFNFVELCQAQRDGLLQTRSGATMPPRVEPEKGEFTPKTGAKPKSENFTVYETTGDETLWRIAKKCYGSGLYFPVLMELNPGLGIYNLEKGKRLKIFNDAARAKRLYHGIIRISGKKRWYAYRVVKGDSLKGIAMKFYGPKGTPQQITDTNPHATVTPGERIQVELN